MKRRLFFAVFLFGFASLTVQILLLRELLVVFYGNELSVGIMLAGWLFWVAAGSFSSNNLLSLIERRLKKDITVPFFRILLLSVSFITPFLIFLIRDIKNALGILPGEVIGITPMALSSFIILAPISLIFGALFAVSCKIASEDSDAPKETGKIYLVESAGAVLGGILFGPFVAYVFSPIQLAFFCGAVNIGAILILAGRKRNPLMRAITFLILIAVITFVFTAAPKVDFSLRRMQWKGLELIAVKDSIYGNITVTKLTSQYSVFENGLVVASTNDYLTAEESVHYALLEHPSPKKILLVGGLLTGAVGEVLKHPVERVDCVELDPDMIKLARAKFPKETLSFLDDPRVKIHYLDARRFIKTLADGLTERYDAVILSLPNPYTAQLNRFYSVEFYREVRAIIKNSGVFSFGLPSSENYISPIHARYLASIYKTLSDEFRDVKILPGDTNYFLACETPEVLTYDYKILVERLKERKINPQFVNKYYMPDKFNPERISYLEKTILNTKDATINKDFHPIGYFYDLVLWSTQHDPYIKALFLKLERIRASDITLVLVVLFLILLALQRRLKDLPVVTSICLTGFSGMLLQVAIILAFQVIYGYVYYKIGWIFASFMIGLVAGSGLAVRKLYQNVRLISSYITLQFFLCAYCALLPFLFFLRIPEAAFMILPALPGFITGAQFPIANAIICKENSKGAKVAGFLYGFDLIGACAGALVTSAILIPIIGIAFACYLTAFLNLLIFLLLLLGRRA